MVMGVDRILTPIVTSTGKFRYPVWVETYPDKYTICVSQDSYRFFTDTTVPKEVKIAIAMIKAFPEEVRKVMYPIGMNCYVCPDERLADIGWQLGDNAYMLILREEVFEGVLIRG